MKFFRSRQQAQAARALLALTAMMLFEPSSAIAQSAAAGRTKAQACTPCHGPVGISVQPDAPNLAGQPETYLVQQLKAYRGGLRQHEVMSVMAKPLKDADIADLAAWFASIQVTAQPR